MNVYTTVMLVCGVILFFFVLGLLAYLVKNKRPVGWLMPLFLVAICMIGFPSVKSINMWGAEIDLQTSLSAIKLHPGDPGLSGRVQQSLEKLNGLVTLQNSSAAVAEQIAQANEFLGQTDEAMKWAQAALKKSPGSPAVQQLIDRVQIQGLLPPDFARIAPAKKAELAAAASRLGAQPDLSAESHLILARAQWALGNNREAGAALKTALDANTNLYSNPEADSLIKHLPAQDFKK